MASFVACFFSSKHWHWAQVLLVEVLFLAGLGYLVLAGEVLRVRSLYGKAYAANTQVLEREGPLVDALLKGTSDRNVISSLEADDLGVALVESAGEEELPRMLGLRDLHHKLGLVTRTRGRVWREVTGVGFDAATLTVSLSIEVPDPHGIETDAILYVFEQGSASEEGAPEKHYLGEFRVTGVADKQIQIQPAGQFGERAIGRLQQTEWPWIIYENIPIDQHPKGLLEIFAGATDDELKQMLPAESVEEYLRHGTPKQADDDEWHVVGFDDKGQVVGLEDWGPGTQYKYRRLLRDYNLIFQDHSKRFIELQADRNSLVEDNKLLIKALASAKELQSRREEDRKNLQHDLAGFLKDGQAIGAHLAQVETHLANAEALLEATLQENASLAATLEAAVQ